MISRGHRNPQGLEIDRDGRIWVPEHGPDGGDELNLIVEGSNYGFPHVSYGVAYGENTWPLSDQQGRHRGYNLPIFAWVPSIGVSNLIQLSGFTPEWDGDLLVGSLYKQTLYRLRYEEGRIIFAEPVPVNKEIRDIDQLDDGTIVLWTDASEIVELRPVPRFQEPVPETVASLGASTRDEVMSTIRACKQCHGMSSDAENLKLPNLWGVYGRDIAGTDYHLYSTALRQKRGRWDRAALDTFLQNPDAFASGTTMEYGPIRDDRIRAGVLLYLESLQ
jgi:cytochrome c2